MVFPENVGSDLSIDETCITNGKLYTIVTNKDALVAIVEGTSSEKIIEAFMYKSVLTETTTCHTRRHLVEFSDSLEGVLSLSEKLRVKY